ncbi:MAG TPA: LexA family transcriptional regulator [Campylobacterales bacterium]|nr:LexA family transcriptional regulator [Campylobacterales bacterium]
MLTLDDVLPKIKDILSAELGLKKIFDKDVAKALDIKQLSFATMKKRGSLPLNNILDFCAHRKISINWLLYNQSTRSLEEETQKYANIRYFGDIYASAGGGAFNYDKDTQELTLDGYMLDMIGGIREAKNIDAINVLGDSMEPTLHDGDIIFLNRTIKDITKSGIFAISTDVGLFVKRLLLKSDGSIDLISDNSLYSVETVQSEHVEIIGKVVGSMRGM